MNRAVWNSRCRSGFVHSVSGKPCNVSIPRYQLMCEDCKSAMTCHDGHKLSIWASIPRLELATYALSILMIVSWVLGKGIVR